MRTRLSIVLAAALTSLATTAYAQGYAGPFGSKGDVTFGAERLFGFHWTSNSYEEANGDHHSGSGTSVGLGWYFAQHLQFNQPRLGVDYFVVQDISIGGSLGVFSMNGHGDNGYGIDGFIVAPRVGFNVALSRSISFWPRLGLEYVSVDRDHAFGFGGEANFVFFPRPSWAFLVMPTLDLAPLGGSDRDGNTPNASLHAYSIGISAGILGVL